jgi:hypothetical protein
MKTIVSSAIVLASLTSVSAQAETQIVWRSATTGPIEAAATPNTPTTPTPPTTTPTSPTTPTGPTTPTSPTTPTQAPLSATYGANDVDVPVGKSFSMNLAIANGKAPFHFSLVGGPLPTGVSFNTSTGKISGVPTNKGNYEATVQVRDSTGKVVAFSVYIQVI